MKKLTLLLWIVLLSGCSTKFAYNNIDWLVNWYIDDYVVLDTQQEKQFDAILDKWTAWHRRSELPKYQAHLVEVMGDIKTQQIDETRIAYHRQKGLAHWQRAKTYMADDVVAMSKNLSEQQLTSLFAELERKLVKQQQQKLQESDLSSIEQSENWLNKNQKRAKKWIGKLNAQQKIYITKYQQHYQKTDQHWLTFKRDYQAAFSELLLAGDRSNTFDEQLLALILYPDAHRTKAYLSTKEANDKVTASYIVGILERADDKQLTKLTTEIDKVKKIISSLN